MGSAVHLMRALERVIHVIAAYVNADHLLLALGHPIHVIVARANADQMMNAVEIRLFAAMEIALQNVQIQLRVLSLERLVFLEPKCGTASSCKDLSTGAYC